MLLIFLAFMALIFIWRSKAKYCVFEPISVGWVQVTNEQHSVIDRYYNAKKHITDH